MDDQTQTVTVRIGKPLKTRLQRAANKKAGNLSAEILHRLTDYEFQRKSHAFNSRFIQRQLDGMDARLQQIELMLMLIRKNFP